MYQIFIKLNNFKIWNQFEKVALEKHILIVGVKSF